MMDYWVPILTDKLIEQLKVKMEVLTSSILMAVEEGYDKTGRVVTEGDIYHNQLADFALHNCTFFECFDCKRPYFGGMMDCMQAMQSEEKLKKEDLLCKKCVSKSLDWGK